MTSKNFSRGPGKISRKRDLLILGRLRLVSRAEALLLVCFWEGGGVPHIQSLIVSQED